MLAAVAVPSILRAADLAILQNGFEIRHEKRETVGTNTRLYLSEDPGAGYVDVPTDQIARYEQDSSIKPKSALPTASPNANPTTTDLKAIVEEASKTHSIDPDLINSVIHAESRFNPRAVSPKGAQGLMQLMPGTASQLGVTNAFDPHANVNAGTRYLNDLLIRYNDDVIKALAAYNAGPHRVDQYKGVPPYRETRNYVASIIRDFNQKKLAQQQAKAQQNPSPAALKKPVAQSRRTQRPTVSSHKPVPQPANSVAGQ